MPSDVRPGSESPDGAADSDAGSLDPDAATTDATVDAGADAHVDVPDDGPDVPYDRAVQKSVHNAYERSEPLLDQLVYHRARSVELDIHVKGKSASAPASEWFVYHGDPTVTSCTKLSDCLGQLAAFHAAVPHHDVVTLFVDLKEPFDQGHAPQDLDSALVAVLGRNNIVAPADLMSACPGSKSVRDAVHGACAFPTVGALRGKFIVAVTGGTSCEQSLVAAYGGSDPSERLAFVAPNTDASCPVASYDARPNVVLLNMPQTELARAKDVRSRGLVARVYGLDDANLFGSARSAGVTHLATDKVNFESDPWAVTHGPRGFPFTCEGCGPDLEEPASVLGVEASSGDVWQTSDSAFGAFESATADASWTAFVSVPSSHVEPFAKACLVARASMDADAANVAVCRPFDDHPPRVQIRSTKGAETTSMDVPAFDGVRAESPAFLRLGVKQSGSGSRVTAEVSADGTRWSTITTVDVATALPMRGISVSSHGSGKVKGLFVRLTKTQNGVASPVTSTLLTPNAIGKGASGSMFDGVFAP